LHPDKKKQHLREQMLILDRPSPAMSRAGGLFAVRSAQAASAALDVAAAAIIDDSVAEVRFDAVADAAGNFVEVFGREFRVFGVRHECRSSRVSLCDVCRVDVRR
jgi:hypothetical protein